MNCSIVLIGIWCGDTWAMGLNTETSSCMEECHVVIKKTRAAAAMNGCVWTQWQMKGINLSQSEKFHLTVEVKMLFGKYFLHSTTYVSAGDIVGAPPVARSDRIAPNPANSKTTDRFSFFETQEVVININSMDEF